MSSDGTTDLEPDAEHRAAVESEQATLDWAHECLARMQAEAQRIAEGEFPGLVYADGMVSHEDEWKRTTHRRIRALTIGSGALCFGRIDDDRDRLHIGRRHVDEQDGTPVVVDWRAPAAKPFYRATVADPMGVRLRRRLLVEDRRVLDLFDEHLDDPDEAELGSYVPDPLLAELGRTRTGEMRDIVATIAAEQDVVIRAPLDRLLIVQGGPGTGKTAVGLHRAAFLLYEHRDSLEGDELLIVGPNPVFLRYISEVLPSLGETASVQTTVELLARGTLFARATEPDELTRLKGDERMASVVARAATIDLSAPREPVVVPTAFGPVRFEPEGVAAIVVRALESRRSLSASRDVLREQLLSLAWNGYLARRTADVAHHSSLVEDLRGRAEFKRLVQRTWPVTSGPALIRKLWSSRRFLARAADGLLSEDEWDRLYRPQSGPLKQDAWTHADLVLIDEAESIIRDPVRTYGHVIVDEAQDLSAMELRLVARRSRTGSMTILGDLAQATAPGAQSSWADAARCLGDAPVQRAELDVGYRVPEPILAFANRLLPGLAVDVAPSRSVRTVGDRPRLIAGQDVGGATATTVAELLERWGSVGVIAAADHVGALVDTCEQSGLTVVDARRNELGDGATVVPAALAKGLEFDAVVVVEPAAIVDETARGLSSLYVALTRAVQELVVVHSGSLPHPLAEPVPV